MNIRFSCVAAAAVFALVSALAGCTATLVDHQDDASSTTGGAATGGAASGGAATGGTATGGTATGGTATGGTATGGVASGGTGTGGVSCDTATSSSLLAASTGEVLPATFETLKQVLDSNFGCAASDCHAGSEHTPMQLVLDDTLHTYLTTHVSTGCCNLKVVEPGYPERSALVRVLKGPCGDIVQMPHQCETGEFGTCLPVNYVEAIEQWIAAGALPQ